MFVGAVAADRVPALIDALPVFFDPFVLRLERHALWGNGIAALEPAGDGAALMALQAGIAERTAALGFAPEVRRYRPHVTLARDAGGSVAPADADGVAWAVTDYTLVESRGGRYEVLATWRR